MTRQYFMTLGQIEDAVVKQITESTSDYNALTAALQTATNTVAAAHPAQTLHYSYFAYKLPSGQWVAQIDIYRGESSPLNHWDASLLMDMQNNEGNYTMIIGSLVTTYAPAGGSALGTFTPPPPSDGT